MKKNTRKGFTLVELVIVIAVIAILAGVLIPTFSNVITKAKASAAQQQAIAEFKEDYAVDLADGIVDGQDGTKATPTQVGGGSSPNSGYYADNGTAKYKKVIDGFTVEYNGTKWTVD